MNVLARLPDLKRATRNESASYDPDYIADAEEESRAFERATARRFSASREARHFDGEGRARLYFRGDLASVEAVALDLDGDGTFETTLTEGADFLLWPEGAGGRYEPYRAIEALPAGELSTWTKGPRLLRVTGLWGYSYELESTGLVGTLGSETDTTLTTTAEAVSVIYPGDTIVQESEQMSVSAVANVTITVVRGTNGTVAAAHSAKAISLRRYPRDVERAIRERVAGGRWRINSGYNDDTVTDVGARGREYARYREVVRRYSEVPI